MPYLWVHFGNNRPRELSDGVSRGLSSRHTSTLECSKLGHSPQTLLPQLAYWIVLADWGSWDEIAAVCLLCHAYYTHV